LTRVAPLFGLLKKALNNRRSGANEDTAATMVQSREFFAGGSIGRVVNVMSVPAPIEDIACVVFHFVQKISWKYFA
jgi:hypothetical protein